MGILKKPWPSQKPSAFAGVKSGYIRGDKDMMIVEGKVLYMESALG